MNTDFRQSFTLFRYVPESSSSRLVRLLTRIQITGLIGVKVSCQVLIRLNKVHKSKIGRRDRVSHSHLDIEWPGQDFFCREGEVGIFL